MPLFDPPKSFVRQLRAYDPMLRIRWSDRECRWRVERKLHRSRSVDPGLFKHGAYEDFVAARDGYYTVLFAGREQLDRRVFFALFETDIQRQGGGRSVADRLEAREETMRRAARARWLDDIEYMARERWSYMNTIRVTPEQHRHSTPRGGMSVLGGV